MDAPLWLFQRDEVDVLEAELDDVWNRHMRRGKGHVDEESVLREYAETEDRSDTDLLLQFGAAHMEEGPCTHEDQQRQAFESMTALEYLRRGTERDALYAGAYVWARQVSTWAQEHAVSGAPDNKERFRVYLNALLVPVKIAFAQAGEVHEGPQARAASDSDYELALVYLGRASESLHRLHQNPWAMEAERMMALIVERRGRLLKKP